MTSVLALQPAAAFLHAVRTNGPALDDRDDRVTMFRDATDWGSLDAVGWNETDEVIELDYDHPCVPAALCERRKCGDERPTSRRLCHRCREQARVWLSQRGIERDKYGLGWQDQPDPDVDRFVQETTRTRRSSTFYPPDPEPCAVCRVPGHVQPAVIDRQGAGLCETHRDRWDGRPPRLRDESIERWLASQEPIRHDGRRCAVPGCTWLTHRDQHLCHPHHQRSRTSRRRGRGPEGVAQLPLDMCVGRLVVRGLPEPLRSEYLWWMSHRARTGKTIRPQVQNRLLTVLYEEVHAGARSVMDLPPGLPTDKERAEKTVRYGFSQLAREVALHAMSIEELLRLDVWPMSKLMPGYDYEVYLSFEGFRQPWLKDLAKWYARVNPRQMEPKNLRSYVQALETFGATLLQRDDHGHDPELLRRADVERFLRHVRRQVAEANLTPYSAESVVARLRKLLVEARERDFALMRLLHRTFTVFDADVPRAPRPDLKDEEPGRAFSEHVLRTLLVTESIGRLNPTMRMLVATLAETGRRPQEVTRANPSSCLQWDEIVDEASGQRRASPVFVHDMPKVRKRGFRLPITEELAEQLGQYIAWLDQQYPDTPLEQQALIPSDYHNAFGTKPLATAAAGHTFRKWTGSLIVDGHQFSLDDGTTPFPLEDLTLYGFRHNYAQRHVDAGTPIHTLKDLLGHASFKSTRAYYSVRMRDRRAATQRLGQLRVDQAGRSVTLVGDADSMVVREQVGELPVPYGYCTQPSNVRSHGRSCPHRYVCTGCSYFRTDPSHLPDLQRYRTQLVTQRDLLADPVDALAEWARPAARPSDDEIAAVERVIAALEERIAATPEDDRAALRASIETAASARRQLRGAAPRAAVGQPLPVLYPETLDA